MRLVTPEQMREMDRRTIEEVGIPGLVLMERAALGAVQTMYEYLPADQLGQICFVCGGGNNGGDGIAMARMVASHGYEPVIVLMSGADSIAGDAATNLEIARKLDIAIVELGACDPDEVGDRLEELGECVAWCDALLGTGIDRDVEGRYAAAIEFLNRQAFLFSVDIPSGINGTSGEEMGVGVHADVTATFGELKLGQALYPGRVHCGDLHVIDIGIPLTVTAAVGWEADLIDGTWARERMAARPVDYHKGDSGKLLILAGSHEKTGAALLATRGALASGAGLLTVGTHDAVVSRVAPAVHEAMAAHLLSNTPDDTCQRRLAEFLDNVDAVGMGPGMGTTDGAREALMTVLDSRVDAAVFDADALTLLAQEDGYDRLRSFADERTVVLTPHPGEMATLCGCSIAEVTAAPLDRARALADETGAFVVLKTATTIVCAPDGRAAVNSTGNPGMSTGGVGDVLTGVITARLAERSEAPFDAVCLAVYAHASAGDLAAEALGERGMGAVNLAEHLPDVWKQLEQ
jgi:NAD(P)H-hydrate epimerase